MVSALCSCHLVKFAKNWASTISRIARVLVLDLVPNGPPVVRTLVFPPLDILQAPVERTISWHFGHANGIQLVDILTEKGPGVERSIEASGMSSPGVAGDPCTPFCPLHCFVNHAWIYCTPKFIHNLRIYCPPVACSETGNKSPADSQDTNPPNKCAFLAVKPTIYSTNI